MLIFQICLFDPFGWPPAGPRTLGSQRSQDTHAPCCAVAGVLSLRHEGVAQWSPSHAVTLTHSERRQQLQLQHAVASMDSNLPSAAAASKGDVAELSEPPPLKSGMLPVLAQRPSTRILQYLAISYCRHLSTHAEDTLDDAILLLPSGSCDVSSIYRRPNL